MRRPVFAALMVAALVTGCATVRDSRFNPFNWFGAGATEPRQAARTAETATREPTDPRPLVREVTQMEVARRPGGAILRATGLPPRQGYWNAELVPRNREDPLQRTLAYDFRLSPPPEPHPAGTEASRLVTVARFVSDQTLAGVNRIVVVGGANQAVSRR